MQRVPRFVFFSFLFVSTLASRAVAENDLKNVAANPANAPHIELRWLGGATMAITFNDVTLLTDPTIGRDGFLMGDPNEMFDLARGPRIVLHKRQQPVPDFDLEIVDVVLLSHAHEDHFDQTASSLLDPDIQIIAPNHDAEKLEALGFSTVQTLAWGGHHVIPAGHGEIEIVAIPADHSRRENISAMLGKGNGYWISFRQQGWEKTIYWTGDSFPTPRVLTAIKPFTAPDVFMPHMGKVGVEGALGQLSMAASDVAEFQAALGAAMIVPIHHTSYDLYREPVHALDAIRAELSGELVYPVVGEILSLY